MLSFDVPVPPSVNNLYFNRRGGGRATTDRYATWLNAAGWDIRAAQPQMIAGHVAVEYVLPVPTTKRRSDLGNREKALSDALVKFHVIEDDSSIVEIVLKYGPVERCRVTVRQAQMPVGVELERKTRRRG